MELPDIELVIVIKSLYGKLGRENFRLCNVLFTVSV